MLKIKRSKEYKRMMNGEYYQPLVIACFAAFWATIGLVVAMI